MEAALPRRLTYRIVYANRRVAFESLLCCFAQF
jgi:hypothetical protein